MSEQPKNGPEETNEPMPAIQGKRVKDMTADELIEAMKQIVMELDRRNPKSD